MFGSDSESLLVGFPNTPDTIYFHNKFGWYKLNPEDMALNDAKAGPQFWLHLIY